MAKIQDTDNTESKRNSHSLPVGTQNSIATIKENLAASYKIICNIIKWLSNHGLSPGSSDGKEYAYNVGDLGSIPGLGRFLEEGMATHSTILAWRIPLNRGAWQATVHRAAESDRMSD